MTIQMTTTAAITDLLVARVLFEGWTLVDARVPYHLAPAKDDTRNTYGTERTEATYRGYAAGLAAPGVGSIQSQFEAWASDTKAHQGLALSLEASKYFNFGLYRSETTQHAYEGFLGAYEARLQPVAPNRGKAPAPPEQAAAIDEVTQLRAALAAERARNAQLTFALAEFERLKHPELLYLALQQGLPARLPERWYQHLANCADDTLLPAA